MKLKLKQDVPFGTNILKVKVPKQLRNKIRCGIDYVDAAFGGEGFTPSCVTLFTGTPGSGKTTMMLTIADSITKQGGLALFNTAEESLFQVKLVAERLQLNNGLHAGGETHVPTLLAECDKIRKKRGNKNKPFFLIIDSLQCMTTASTPARTAARTSTAARPLAPCRPSLSTARRTSATPSSSDR